MIARFRWAAVGLAAVALALPGCQPSSVNINGKLLKNGAPMVVSKETYVTLSFLPEAPDAENARGHSAKFDQQTGSYTIELPPGKYKIMLVVAKPAKNEGETPVPSPPYKPDKVYDLTKSQTLDIDVPGP